MHSIFIHIELTQTTITTTFRSNVRPFRAYGYWIVWTDRVSIIVLPSIWLPYCVCTQRKIHTLTRLQVLHDSIHIGSNRRTECIKRKRRSTVWFDEEEKKKKCSTIPRLRRNWQTFLINRIHFKLSESMNSEW